MRGLAVAVPLLFLAVSATASAQSFVTPAMLSLEFEGKPQAPVPGEVWVFEIDVVLTCMNVAYVMDETTIDVVLGPDRNMEMSATAMQLVFPTWACAEKPEVSQHVAVTVTFPDEPPGTVLHWRIDFNDATEESPTHGRVASVTLGSHPDNGTVLQGPPPAAATKDTASARRDAPLGLVGIAGLAAALVIVRWRRGTTPR